MSVLSANPVGDIAVDPTSDRLVTTHRDGVSVVCASDRTLFKRIAIGARPSCAATSSAMGQLYVADHAGNVTTPAAVTAMLQAAAS